MEYLDEIDWKILAALQKTANLPNTELADQVGLTPAPCLRRVKKLTEMGVIKGFVLALDNKQLGFAISALLEITLTHRTTAATNKFLKTIQGEQQVVACYMVTGNCDFVLRIMSPDIDSYRKLIWEDLNAIEGVQRIRSSIILETFKDQLSPTLGVTTPRAKKR